MSLEGRTSCFHCGPANGRNRREPGSRSDHPKSVQAVIRSYQSIADRFDIGTTASVGSGSMSRSQSSHRSRSSESRSGCFFERSPRSQWSTTPTLKRHFVLRQRIVGLPRQRSSAPDWWTSRPPGHVNSSSSSFAPSFQIGRVEALGEPAVDRREQLPNDFRRFRRRRLSPRDHLSSRRPEPDR